MRDEITVRRLGPDDADVVHAFADGDGRAALLDDARTIWVLTDADNEPANRLYGAAGGEPREVVEWDFRCEER